MALNFKSDLYLKIWCWHY